MKLKKKNIEILNLIKKSRSILITGHMKPDGDVIGAALTIKKIAGSKVDIIFKGYPEYDFSFLKGFESIKFVDEKVSGSWEAGIFIECPEFKRNGGIFDLNQFKKIISIDHHEKPVYFGDININEPHASSVSEVVCKIIPEKFLKDKDIATYLLTGIITDTNRFQQSNTTPEAMYYSSILLKTGVDIEKIVRSIYYSYEMGIMRLLEVYIKRLEFKNHVAFGYILQSDIENCGIKNFNGEYFVNFPLEFKGIKASALVYETPQKKLKISLRGLKPVGVIDVAKEFGGGGHRYAAGATLEDLSIDTLKEIIFRKLA